MTWTDVGLLMLGSVLALLGGFVADEVRNMRRLRASGRLLLHELQRLEDNLENRGLADPPVRERIRKVLDSYAEILFLVNQASFEEHWPIYREFVEALDLRDAGRAEARIILHTARKLRALLGYERRIVAVESAVASDSTEG